MAQITSELEENLFIRLLTTSLDRRLTDSERKALDAANEDYINTLHAMSQDLRKSPLETLHSHKKSPKIVYSFSLSFRVWNITSVNFVRSFLRSRTRRLMSPGFPSLTFRNCSKC